MKTTTFQKENKNILICNYTHINIKLNIGDNMNKQKQLTISMAIFAFFVFVSFGVIVTMEKSSTLLIPKIEEKLTTYLYEEYPQLKNEVKIESTKYKNTIFTMKVVSNQNKNLFFTINYTNKKITDNYKEEYVKGKTFLKYVNNNISKEVTKVLNNNSKTTITSTLDQFTNSTTNKILKEENLSNIRIYNLESKINIDNWEPTNIANKIKEYILTTEQKNITPKTYTIILKDNNKKLKISNITYKTIEKDFYNQLIFDIINNNNSELIKENEIKYKYTN